MRVINSKIEYSTICTKKEELLALVSKETSEEEKNYIKLDLLSVMKKSMKLFHLHPS